MEKATSRVCTYTTRVPIPCGWLIFLCYSCSGRWINTVDSSAAAGDPYLSFSSFSSSSTINRCRDLQVDTQPPFPAPFFHNSVLYPILLPLCHSKSHHTTINTLWRRCMFPCFPPSYPTFVHTLPKGEKDGPCGAVASCSQFLFMPTDTPEHED